MSAEPAVSVGPAELGGCGIAGEAVPFPGGCARGPIRGTTWHGLLEADGFRRAFLREVAREAGRRFVPAPGPSFHDVRQRRLDILGDLVAEHLDTAALLRLIERGAPADMPFIPPGAP